MFKPFTKSSKNIQMKAGGYGQRNLTKKIKGRIVKEGTMAESSESPSGSLKSKKDRQNRLGIAKIAIKID